jgi:2-polyprenyl-3-methyl-5-hydroxy-6-metoxy-1,4-benzoquinol methylase
MSKAEKFWDKVSNGYNKPGQELKGLALKTMEATRPYLSSKHVVLDFGCGGGLFSREISKYVSTVTGVDFSEGMIAAAHANANGLCISNVDFVQGTIVNPIFDEESFDVIVAFNVLHFVNDAKTLRHIYKLLKSGGLFLSATACVKERVSLLRVAMTPVRWLGLIPPMQYFTLRELQSIIEKPGFSILHSQKLSTLPDYFIAAQKQ